MYIAELDQEIAIHSVFEAQSLVDCQRNYWNVISIVDALAERPTFESARRVLYLRFDDVDGTSWFQEGVLATQTDVRRALRFAREIKNEPLIIHCTAGVSRSPAIAWVVICDKLRGHTNAGQLATQIVLRLRPQSLPNRHVLNLGLKILAASPQQHEELRGSLMDWL
ncbi:MAG: hypothetical protein N3G20_10830 [Verrucomicrobiae bacterium]|nr:hypothetical protein [Verrucomicrobiae bacterium]